MTPASARDFVATLRSRYAHVQRRLDRVLAELPDRVQAYLENLEDLLANRQIERGKQILAGLGTLVIINPNGTAGIRGDLGKALRFIGPTRKPDSSLWWLGEEDSNPR